MHAHNGREEAEMLAHEDGVPLQSRPGPAQATAVRHVGHSEYILPGALCNAGALLLKNRD